MRRDSSNVLRKEIDFNVFGRKGRRRSIIWKRQVKEKIEKQRKLQSTEQSGAVPPSLEREGVTTTSGTTLLMNL